jgi:UDP-2-acetamido-2,6-beta-L-arabino-hexul-4-ose reductase
MKALNRPLEPTAVVQRIPGSANMRVSKLLELLTSLCRSFFESNIVPDLGDPLAASLYSTFLYYVSPDDHRHRPTVHTDERGGLYEVIKLAKGGQVFFSTTRPGVVRGNHYHTRKIEWFCVVRGEALIRLRRVDSDQVHEFRVSGEHPEFISIPVLHTHSIENVGQQELLTMFWCNEIFDGQDTDTIYAKVA